MNKTWNIPYLDRTFVTDTKDILNKYVKSLNKEQQYFVAETYAELDSEGYARLYFRVQGKTNPLILVRIFELSLSYEGNIYLTINYLNETKNIETTVDNLDKTLEEIVKSDLMGKTIGYLITLIKNGK